MFTIDKEEKFIWLYIMLTTYIAWWYERDWIGEKIGQKVQLTDYISYYYPYIWGKAYCLNLYYELVV